MGKVVDLTDPHERGRVDFARGISRDENPYERDYYGTTLWEGWFDGWDEAKEESKSE